MQLTNQNERNITFSHKACPDVGVQYHHHGTQVGSVDNTIDWQHCANECKRSAVCEYWTWWRNNGLCQFLSGKSPTKATTNAVSGKKGCTNRSRNMVYIQNHDKLFKRSIGN